MALLLALGGVEVYSKNCHYQSGRADLNRRPLDPQSPPGRRWAWLERAHWTLDQPQQSPDVARCRLRPACVGSWNGSFTRGGWPPVGGTAKTVNNARRAVMVGWQLIVDHLSWLADLSVMCAMSMTSADVQKTLA